MVERPVLIAPPWLTSQVSLPRQVLPRQRNPGFPTFKLFSQDRHFLGRLNLHHCSAIGSIWLNKKSSNVKTPESTRLRRDGFLPLCLFA